MRGSQLNWEFLKIVILESYFLWYKLTSRLQIWGVFRTNWQTVRTNKIFRGIADKSERRTIYITRNPACASLLKPNTDANRDLVDSGKFDVIATAKINVQSVQNALPNRIFDAVKIDVFLT